VNILFGISINYRYKIFFFPLMSVTINNINMNNTRIIWSQIEFVCMHACIKVEKPITSIFENH